MCLTGTAQPVLESQLGLCFLSPVLRALYGTRALYGMLQTCHKAHMRVPLTPQTGVERVWIGRVPGEGRKVGPEQLCSSKSRASMENVLSLHSKRAAAETSSPLAGLLAYLDKGNEHPLHRGSIRQSTWQPAHLQDPVVVIQAPQESSRPGQLRIGL